MFSSSLIRGASLDGMGNSSTRSGENSSFSVLIYNMSFCGPLYPSVKHSSSFLSNMVG